MAMTFNRRPLSVNTPSSSDLKEHFFNHYNWKGMNVNKNFLAADQETFEECNNVYMNAEGLLRSRPSIKPFSTETNIRDYWFLSGIEFLYVDNPASSVGQAILYAKPKNKEQKSLNFSNVDKLTLIPKNNKIFIFADNGTLLYYDIITNSYYSINATNINDFVYVPEVEVVSGTEIKKNESKNLMVNGQITTYLYSSETIPPKSIDNKNFSVTINGQNYSSTFDRGTTPSTLVDVTDNLPGKTNYMLSKDVSGTTVYVACEITTPLRDFDDDSDLDLQIKTIYTKIGSSPWINRETFDNAKQLSVDSLQKSIIGISDDGLIFYCAFTDGLHFLSILPNENGLYDYPDMKPALGSTTSYSIKGCRVVTKNKYLFLLRSGTTNYAHDGEKSYYFANPDGSYYNDFDVIASDVLYDTVTGTFSAYMASHVNGTTLYLGKLTEGVDDYFGFIVQQYGKVTRHISIKALQGYKAHYAYDRDNNPDYRIYDFESRTDVFIETNHGYNDANNSYLMNLSSRFSDDGTKLFLPSGIYFIDIEKYVKYLNVEANLYVTNHSTGNDTCYSFRDDNAVFSNVIIEPLVLKVKSALAINSDFIESVANGIWTELNEYYIANEQKLYITEARVENDTLWYFPEINELNLPSKITALHPISKTEVALFTFNEICYTTYQEGLYSFYKSKLKLGLHENSDVITTYDGTNVIFATERGLASLSYQNFVASTDQMLTYLSDPISEKFKELLNLSVKLLRYQYYILVHSPELETGNGYLLDLRNGSWWPMSCHLLPNRFYVVNDEVILLANGRLFKLDKSDEDYYDYDGTKHQINWNFKSQKLHLNAVNYYKHISNLTLYSVLDTDREMNFVMDVNNYRKQIDTTEIQTISYKVDTIRTFVKRVSYPKVNEFQYNMHQDDEREIRLPLSLSGITIKYKISGQVR